MFDQGREIIFLIQNTHLVSSVPWAYNKKVIATSTNYQSEQYLSLIKKIYRRWNLYER